MITHFANHAYASVFMWAENRYLNQLQAYKNYTSRLYYQDDPSVPSGYVAYAAPFKQWVYDAGVQGANIISGISGANGWIGRGTSGLKIDYNNGRVLLDESVGTGLNITGSYAFKDINLYMSNITQDELLSQDNFYINPRFHSLPTGATQPNSMAAPAMFLEMLNADNQPFEFGGIDMSHYNFTMTVFTETPFQMRNLFGAFQDTKRSYVPVLDISDSPLDELSDLTYNYNYLTLRDTKGTPGNLMLIDKVNTSLVGKSKTNQALYRGIIDIDVMFPRQTANLFVGSENYIISDFGFYIVGSTKIQT